MRNDRKFRDCSALYVTCFKIDVTTTYFWSPADSILPTHWKTISLNSAKTLLISHYKWNIWSLCCENHSIACSFSSGYLGVIQPIFAHFLIDFSPTCISLNVKFSIPTKNLEIFSLFYLSWSIILYKELQNVGLFGQVTA